MFSSTSPFRIALISMPWSLFNRPSIQLGSLKAYLEQQEEVAVDCHHPYLDAARTVGVETYSLLSKNSWAGEALYSAILYPEKETEAGKVYRRCLSDTRALADRFTEIKRQLEESLLDWVETIDFASYRLIGFSVCFSQLFGSLAAAEQIKKKAPDAPIVFGGSSCGGEMGASLVEVFSQVDHIIEGEGEEQLAALCRRLGGFQGEGDSLHNTENNDPPLTHQISLDELPIPDYHDYFRDLDRTFPGRPFSPILPIEFSRGCWWRKCSFCNLNLQWHGYRRKRPEKLLGEVEEMNRRHQCLDFSFCDNALPPAESDRFFETTSDWNIDINFFAEIRAADDPRKLSRYSRGGLRSVQVGIEALSSSLLAKMKKGVRVIDNLAVMKYCRQHDIQLDGNLIVEFPGTSRQEIDETIATLDYVLPFRPLSPATFFLGRGAPMEKNPRLFGIRATTKHPYYQAMLPSHVIEQLDVLIKDYRGDKTVQRRRWLPVRRKIARWHDFHAGRTESVSPLSYRDGGSFLLIRQERTEGRPLIHRLKGSSRKLYLYCDTIRSIDDIMEKFTGLKKQAVMRFFDDLSNKRLLFRENNHFLALAVPAYRRTKR